MQAAPPHIPGAWILSTQLTTPDGRPVSTVPYSAACGPNAPGNSCQGYIASLHLRQTVNYQPASRYRDFQWTETGIYLTLALILAGLCFLRIRPGRPRRTRHPSPPSHPFGPRAQKVPMTLGDPKEPGSRRSSHTAS